MHLNEVRIGNFYLARDLRIQEQVLLYCYGMQRIIYDSPPSPFHIEPIHIVSPSPRETPEFLVYNKHTRRIEDTLGYAYQGYFRITDTDLLSQDILMKFLNFIYTNKVL